MNDAYFQEQRREYLIKKLIDNYQEYLDEMTLDELQEVFDDGRFFLESEVNSEEKGRY